MGSRQLVENFYHQFTTLLNSYKWNEINLSLEIWYVEDK
jgi:hypothetical protein